MVQPVCTCTQDPRYHDPECPQYTDCGWGWDGPCGGCDRCLAAQVTYYAQLDGRGSPSDLDAP